MNWIRKNRLVVLIVTVLAVFLLVASLSGRREIPVRAQAAHREIIMNSISTNGKVEPASNYEVHSLGGAVIRQVFAHEGDKVKPGQVLLQLDDTDARARAASALARLRGAESSLAAIKRGGNQEELLNLRSALAKTRTERDSAKRNLDALQNLQQRGAASAGEVKAAENRLSQIEADLTLLEQKQTERFSGPEITRVQSEVAEARAIHDAAQKILRNLRVASPIAGTVYSLPVRQGTFVGTGELLVQVADLTKMQVRSFIDEPDIGKLEQGQKVIISWDAIPGRTWEGAVTRVPATVINKGTRTVGEVITAVNNKELTLLPNVNVNVLIATDKQENALTLPREAVMEENGARYVYKIVDGKLKRQEVKTGISSLTRVQITDGLSESALVALGAVNSQPLSEGANVKIVER
jgi:HlyD family secretion protein